MKKLFTSESVTEGHPDKVCDLISDSVLDAMLEQDPNSRVACETCANGNFVLVMGEVTSNAVVDVEKIVRDTIRKIGYTKEEYGFNADTCEIKVMLKKQSADIALGVNNSLEEKNGEGLGEGAGDQGIIFGYACNETESYLPAPIYYAHKLAERLTAVRKEGILTYLRPDGKSQVTVEYDGDKVKRIDAIVVSTQHDDNVEHDKIEKDIIENVVKAVIPSELLDENTKYYINPTGRFVIGGPAGDSGLTGRKIIVDTYGGYAPHGGGAFSGKDPTKVDRSAAYMMRKIAKDIVKAGLAEKCLIQVAYAIGVAKPVSVFVDTYGTNKVSNEEIIDKILREYDMTPKGIITSLDLRKPIYKETTNYGHFGKENLSWEK
ncbi:MAG: methionine adenosyltransferase [Clostridia bacterium]|nr:methionine adenosyltransferase [Clostridia bacterium]